MWLRSRSSVIGVAVVVTLGGPSAVRAEYFVRAAVVDGRVYVSPLANVDAREPGWKEVGGYFTLLAQGLDGRDPVVTLRLPAVVEADPFQPVWHRWHIDGNRVHFVGYNRPFPSGVRLPVYMRESYLVSAPLDLVTKFTAPIRDTFADSARVDELNRSITSQEAGPAAWRFPLYWRVNSWENDWVNFDFLPAGEGRYEWYLSAPDGKRNRVTRWDSRPPSKKGEQTIWTEIGTWTIEAGSAPFVTAAGDERTFVTESGHVFAMPRGGKAGAPLKELWKDKPPVVALIHDTDGKKWYAFTKDEFFEVADPIKPKAHTLAIGRAKTAEEALATAVKCGRVIRGLPEPKGK